MAAGQAEGTRSGGSGRRATGFVHRAADPSQKYRLLKAYHCPSPRTRRGHSLLCVPALPLLPNSILHMVGLERALRLQQEEAQTGSGSFRMEFWERRMSFARGLCVEDADKPADGC